MDRKGKLLTYLKTDSAYREVVLMDELSKKLAAHKLASPFSRDEDFVLASETGTAYNPRNLAQRGLDKATDNAGIEGVTLHVLRHTFASILIQQGRDVLYVSRQMGHKRPSVTLDVYGHLFDRAKQAEDHRSALDTAFGHLS